MPINIASLGDPLPPGRRGPNEQISLGAIEYGNSYDASTLSSGLDATRAPNRPRDG